MSDLFIGICEQRNHTVNAGVWPLLPRGMYWCVAQDSWFMPSLSELAQVKERIMDLQYKTDWRMSIITSWSFVLYSVGNIHNTLDVWILTGACVNKKCLSVTRNATGFDKHIKCFYEVRTYVMIKDLINWYRFDFVTFFYPSNRCCPVHIRMWACLHRINRFMA